ncbi:MAG: hypothetical protein ACOX5Z_02330 [Desulfobulbus sp.]|jgi:hypothetical protein
MSACRLSHLLSSLLLVGLLLSGCAEKDKRPAPPVADTADWLAFLDRKPPQALDADARLQWDVRGNRGAVAATVQTERPALLRFAVHDPLGRDLYLVVADGREFTFVDTRKGRVYRGSTVSEFWQTWVPSAVTPEDLLPMVGGFVLDDEARTARRLGRGEALWYAWNDRRGLTHHVQLNQEGTGLRRHLLIDQGEQVLDIQYTGRAQAEASDGWAWPGELRVTGPSVGGVIELKIGRVYGQEPQGAAVYRLKPPPQFTVEEVR